VTFSFRVDLAGPLGFQGNRLGLDLDGCISVRLSSTVSQGDQRLASGQARVEDIHGSIIVCSITGVKYHFCSRQDSMPDVAQIGAVGSHPARRRRGATSSAVSPPHDWPSACGCRRSASLPPRIPPDLRCAIRLPAVRRGVGPRPLSGCGLILAGMIAAEMRPGG